MELSAGIDLHSNNNVLVVLDESDKVIYQQAQDGWSNAIPISVLRCTPMGTAALHPSYRAERPAKMLRGIAAYFENGKHASDYKGYQNSLGTSEHPNSFSIRNSLGIVG